jgi:hypothetical protein
MARFEVKVSGISEELEAVEAESAELAVRSFIRDYVSRYPDLLEWEITVVAGARFKAKVVGIKEMNGGNIREVEVSVNRVG